MQMADWQIGRLGLFDVSVIYLPQMLRISPSAEVCSYFVSI